MTELKRVLGFWTILALSIGSIIGTGLFFGVSIGAKYSGVSSIIAWVLLSLVAVYISMYFAELVSMFPRAGGIYEFSKHSYNRFFSFLMGWSAWLVSNLSTALLAVAAIDYIIPENSTLGSNFGISTLVLKLIISALLIILLNVVAFVGIEASAFVLILLTAITIGVLLSFIFPGLFILDVSVFSTITLSSSAIFMTIFYLSESFFGWEGATYLAEETKEPEKVIPKAIVIGTVIVGLLGVLMALVSIGIIPIDDLAASHVPLSLVAQSTLGEIGVKILSIGIFVSLIGAAAGGVVTMPRLILALARDKLFISQFSTIHPRFNTPYKAVIFQTVVTLAVLAMAFGKYQDLLNLTLPMGFILYFFVVLSVVILRYKEPDLKRAYKVPFVHIGSLVLMSLIVALLFSWIFPGFDITALNLESFNTLKLGLSLIFVGVPIYLLLEFYYNPDTIIKMNNSLAYLTLIFEGILLPRGIRKEVLALLGNIKGKNVLEFGCSVGTLTMHLAEAVKPGGKVYATDLSIKDLLITKKRLAKRGHSHVTIIHDEHQINRVHPEVPNVDAIISIGMMSYLQDVRKVLKEMRDRLPYGGKIVFMEYADFFNVIPNVAWISNDKTVEKVFREAGFSVYVTRKKGLFWNYVYVYGMKFHENVPYI